VTTSVLTNYSFGESGVLIQRGVMSGVNLAFANNDGRINVLVLFNVTTYVSLHENGNAF